MRNSERRGFLIDAATYSHLGFTLAAGVLLGFFGGNWLDGKWGVKPLFTLIGAFLGAAGGFINLVASLMRMQRRRNNQTEDQSG